MKLKKGDRIEITWRDTYSSGDPEWRTDSELRGLYDKEVKEMLFSSMGRYWGTDGRHVLIVACMSTSPNVKTLLGRELKIPKGCIVSIHKLSKGEKVVI